MRGRTETENEGCSPLPVSFASVHHARRDASPPRCGIPSMYYRYNTKSLPLPTPSSTDRENARGGVARSSRSTAALSPRRSGTATRPSNGTTKYRYRNKVTDFIYNKYNIIITRTSNIVGFFTHKK